MEEDNTQYYNDEWNLPKFEIDKDLEKRYIEKLINSLTGEKEFNSKNDKPDGRRYKK